MTPRDGAPSKTKKHPIADRKTYHMWTHCAVSKDGFSKDASGHPVGHSQWPLVRTVTSATGIRNVINYKLKVF